MSQYLGSLKRFAQWAENTPESKSEQSKNVGVEGEGFVYRVQNGRSHKPTLEYYPVTGICCPPSAIDAKRVNVVSSFLYLKSVIASQSMRTKARLCCLDSEAYKYQFLYINLQFCAVAR